jgi:hypothetical protein
VNTSKEATGEQNNLWDTCNPDLPVEKLRAIVKPEFPCPHTFKRSSVYVEVPVAEGAPCKAQALVSRELLYYIVIEYYLYRLVKRLIFRNRDYSIIVLIYSPLNLLNLIGTSL